MLNNVRHASLGLLLSASLLLPACSSGGNPASPTNTVGGLPPVSNSGGSQRPKVNKLRLTGKVTDAVTGEPVDRATVVIESYEQAAAQPVASTSPGPGVAAPTAVASPQGIQASPAASTSPGTGTTPSPPAASPSPGGGYTPRTMPTMQPAYQRGGSKVRTAFSSGRTRVALDEARETIATASPITTAVTPSPAAAASQVPATGPPATKTLASASPAVAGSGSPTAAKSPVAASASSPATIETTATVAPAADKAAPLAASGPPSMGPPKIYRTTTNNEGKFWFSGVVDGLLAVTVAAPKYRSLTVVNVDADRLSLSLVPNEANLKRVKIDGLVQSVMGKPVPLAIVNPSFMAGDSVGIGTVTDKDGEFDLEEVAAGKRTIVAVVNDAAGNVTSFGMVGDLAVDPTDKKRLPLEMTLKLVTDPIKLRGAISTPKGFTPQMLHVYMTLNDKGEEVLVTSVPLNPKNRTFAVALPILPADEVSYHVEAVASDQSGAVVYHHALGVRDGSADLQVAFMDPPERTVNSVKREDKELIPTFSWASVPDAPLYRLVLLEGDDRTLWEAWTPYTSVTYPLTFGPERVRSKVEYRWTVTAVKGEVTAPGTTAAAPTGKIRYSMLKTPWSDAASITAHSVLITKKDLDKLKEETEK